MGAFFLTTHISRTIIIYDRHNLGYMETLLNGVIVFAACFASLDIIREAYTFYQCYVRVEQYRISTVRMLALWASVSLLASIILS